jgi:hypothetical protein
LRRRILRLHRWVRLLRQQQQCSQQSCRRRRTYGSFCPVPHRLTAPAPPLARFQKAIIFLELSLCRTLTPQLSLTHQTPLPPSQ